MFQEKQLGELELEVRFVQGEMDVIKKEKEKVCRSAPGQSTCYLQPVSHKLSNLSEDINGNEGYQDESGGKFRCRRGWWWRYG